MIIFGSMAIFALSCQNNNNQEDNEKYEFYYYPKKNVYYDLDKKTFFYSLNGGKTWDSSINLSEKEPLTLGEKIIIYSSDYNIYKDNTAHRESYNGKLYNIADTDTASTLAKQEVTERRLIKKSTTEVKPKEEEDKPKKGLKKLFDKIFGKHNKKQEEG